MRDPLTREHLHTLGKVGPDEPITLSTAGGPRPVDVTVSRDGVRATAIGAVTASRTVTTESGRRTEPVSLDGVWDGRCLQVLDRGTAVVSLDQAQLDRAARLEESLSDLRRQAAWFDDGLPVRIDVDVVWRGGQPRGDVELPPDTIVGLLDLHRTLSSARVDVGVQLTTPLEQARRQMDGVAEPAVRLAKSDDGFELVDV